jgi:hypothetical protein
MRVSRLRRRRGSRGGAGCRSGRGAVVHVAVGRRLVLQLGLLLALLDKMAAALLLLSSPRVGVVDEDVDAAVLGVERLVFIFVGISGDDVP